MSVNFASVRLPLETTLVMGFFTEALKGGFVEVQALPVPEEYRDEMLDIVMHVHEDDIPKCLDAFRAGSTIQFILAHAPQPPAPPNIGSSSDLLAEHSLPNDTRFKELYDQCYDQIERSHHATRARHLREGWYRRRHGMDKK
jgi:hypothetical protein